MHHRCSNNPTVVFSMLILLLQMHETLSTKCCVFQLIPLSSLPFPPPLLSASASPFEALAERMNWLKVAPEKDAWGAKLIKAGT